MLRAVDTALAMLEAGQGGTMDMRQLFDGFDPAKYEAEAKERLGDTEAYRESAKPTKRYGQDEWDRIRDERAPAGAPHGRGGMATGAPLRSTRRTHTRRSRR